MKKLVFGISLAIALAAQAEVVVKNGDRIAFLGDSITSNGNHPAGYVNLVMKGLELAGVKAEKVAAGVSGNKSNVEKDVLSRKVQWMTFSCGVNDVWHFDWKKGVPLEDYQRNCGEIFDKCAAAGVKVVVLTATMIQENPDDRRNVALVPYNEWLRAEAKRRNLKLVDLNAAMQAELARIRETDVSAGNKLTVDGVHMAFAGDCLMAWNILKGFGVDDSLKEAVFAAWRKMPEAYKYEVKLTAEENDRLLGRGICPGELVRRLLDADEGWQPVAWRTDAFESGVWKMGVDGVMTATKDDAIWSQLSYGNFELDFDYKLDPAANSGVIIYASDVKNWIPNSIEVQLLDDYSDKWKNDPPRLKNGSIYGHVGPAKSSVRKAGEWNRMTVWAQGKRIRAVVNGETSVDVDLSAFTSAKTNPDGSPIPPWLSRPLAELPTHGAIGFQGKHGGARPYFRNIRIRKL